MKISRNQKCIINTDLDGVFSGLLLHNYLNWEVVGFCDSAETIWIDKTKCNNIKDCVFVDMYLLNEDIKCIDQHIISVDDEHNKILSENDNKLNPNLLNKRNFLPNQSYYNKYPFGTAHFIIAWLEQNGVELNINLHNKVNENISVIDLLLRADDAFQTSCYSRYTDNANDWWKWLVSFSDDGKTSVLLSDYINKSKQYKTESQVADIKTSISKLLKSSPYFCNSPDGGYKNESYLGTDNLKDNVKEYISFIAEKSGLECFSLDFDFRLIKGIAKRTSLTKNQLERFKKTKLDDKILTYAFVRSSNRDDNFSYTIFEL